MTRRAGALLATALLLTFLAACGGGSSGSKSSAAPHDAGEPAAVGDTTSLPPGAVAGLDDYDGDGQPDPTCGTQDFGGGLILRVPCQIATANSPEEGARLVADSLYRLPGSTDVDLTGISGSLVLARDTGGGKVVIVVFNSDNLFETGSAAIGSTDTMDATIRLINRLYPRSAIQVRGHTDSTGGAALNQALSEQRAATVAQYLKDHGVAASSITSVGFGSTRPLSEERNPDGSDSPAGRRFNRRVEIVLHLPA
jgi:outer membrane protein OmpA-like peptidoglycan-associated protein